jgi:hypothetical protein
LRERDKERKRRN